AKWNDLYEQKRRNELWITKKRKLERDKLSDACPQLTFMINTIGCRPQVAARSREHCEKTADKGNLVNSSDAVLRREETNVLFKGLTFCPTAGNYTEFQLYQDLEKFGRNMRLREYFHDRQPNPNQTILSNPKKQWTPNPRR
ncbi:hypothetical protein HPB47_010833, partial [Ixodes persulcatus]